jgi:hypothetical protein
MKASIMRTVLPLLLCFSAALQACGGATSKDASGAGAAASTASGPKAVDACALLTQQDVAALVGNPVAQGQAFAGPEVCKWDAEPNNVTLLLTVRPAGSTRETVLCPELQTSTEGQRLDGVADVAVWKFSNTMGLFNSGDLETCSRKGYVSLSLNGQKDEPRLREAAVAIARKVLHTL